MNVFLVVGGIGIALLLLGLIFDGVEHVFDVLGAADGLLSITALGSALAIFGASGLIVGWFALPQPLALPLSVVLGVAAWLAVARLVNAVKRSARPGYRRVELVGDTGRTTLPTGPEIGEVQLDSAGEHNPRLARSTGALIPAGTEIRVVAMDGSRVVVAAEWPTAPTASDHDETAR